MSDSEVGEGEAEADPMRAAAKPHPFPIFSPRCLPAPACSDDGEEKNIKQQRQLRQRHQNMLLPATVSKDMLLPAMTMGLPAMTSFQRRRSATACESPSRLALANAPGSRCHVQRRSLEVGRPLPASQNAVPPVRSSLVRKPTVASVPTSATALLASTHAGCDRCAVRKKKPE